MLTTGFVFCAFVALLSSVNAGSPTASPTFSTHLYLQTYVGNGATVAPSQDGLPALNNPAGSPSDCLFDSKNNMYYSDTNYRQLRVVHAATGLSYSFAGVYTVSLANSDGDGGQATAAHFMRPQGLNWDANGDMLVCDCNAHVIRKIKMSNHIISAFAGTNRVAGFGGDGGQATNALLNTEMDTISDGSGNILVADRNNNRIRLIDGTTKIITTLYGLTTLTSVSALSFNPDKSYLYASLYLTNKIVKINTATQAVTCVIGCVANRNPYNGGYDGDGGLAVNAHVMFYNATAGIGIETAGMVVDDYGGVVISDARSNVIRYIDTAGYVSTLAGYYVQPGGFLDGYATYPGYVYPGDRSLQSLDFYNNAARMREPRSLVKDTKGIMFFVDKGSERIRALFNIDRFPTLEPTAGPTNPTAHPTAAPTGRPAITASPTSVPTREPTAKPSTATPTAKPTTQKPNVPPTAAPTTSTATDAPTDAPTHAPTDAPTESPTDFPTDFPTDAPVSVSAAPSKSPSRIPCVPRTRSPAYVPRTRSPAYTPCPTRA